MAVVEQGAGDDIWAYDGDVTGGWENNAEHQDLYATPNIIKVIRRKTMRWAEIVESMETKISEYRVLVDKLKKKITCKTQTQLV